MYTCANTKIDPDDNDNGCIPEKENLIKGNKLDLSFSPSILHTREIRGKSIYPVCSCSFFVLKDVYVSCSEGERKKKTRRI